MWARRSHKLVPLTKLTPIKVNFKWAKIKQEAFEEIKRIVAHNISLAFPDFNVEFIIHTYAIRFQLGTVIVQEGKPIDFYSRKLTETQKRYTVTKK